MAKVGTPAEVRASYLVGNDVTDRGVAATVARAVMDVLDDVAVSAYVDCVSDFSERMPPEIRAVEDELSAANPSGIDVTVERADAARWALVRAYAGWSIYTDLHDARGRSVASFHDSGYSVIAELTNSEASDLTQRLHGIAPVRLLSEVLAEERRQRREQRRTRWRQALRLHR